MNIMEGAHMTPEMLKVNPWHQMPNMSDGDVHLGESGAIIRYIANKYAPEMYGGSDLAAKATITIGTNTFSCISIAMAIDATIYLAYVIFTTFTEVTIVTFAFSSLFNTYTFITTIIWA